VTGTQPESHAARRRARPAAGGWAWLAGGWAGGDATGTPSRRVTAVLVAAVLAIGIVAGAALGPAPSGSPADAATLAQQAIAALTTQASARPPASAPTSSTTTPASEPATSASAPSEPAKAASKAVSTPASSENSSASEGSSGTPSSEGSSSEGPSKGSGKGKKAAPGTPIKLPAIKHVWVIALSGTSFSAALADPTADPYLAKRLVPKGTLLSDYTFSSSSALGNGIALLAGQSVNLDTEQNCPTYTELQPPTVNATTGLAEGVGCVYPATVKTLADELTAGSLTWKAYVQDMEADAAAGTAPAATTPSATSTTPATGTQTQPASGVTCRRPALSAADPNHTPTPGDPYLTYRNPFVYFQSLLGEGACASNDVSLTQLRGDLATPAQTPSLSWIVPSACSDGSSAPCAPGAPAGLAPADSFLQEVVPQILATSAYGREGLIVIVPDSPPSSPPAGGAASKPVGALLLSPFVRGGARVGESFNDFSLLKSLSLLFGVLPLGHAGDPSTVSFGASVYSTTK
jgi:hypothetical protein